MIALYWRGCWFRYSTQTIRVATELCVASVVCVIDRRSWRCFGFGLCGINTDPVGIVVLPLVDIVMR